MAVGCRGDLEKWLKQRAAIDLRGFTIKHADHDLLEWDVASQSIMVKAPEEDKDKNRSKVQEEIDRAGLREVKAHYLPTMNSPEQSMHTDSAAFPSWLKGIVSKERGCLVVDTNMIWRHYTRNLLLPKAHKDLVSTLMIPRLALLEIERKCNQGRDRDRRIALSAACEIMLLKSAGARFLPELDIGTLESFSRIAGEHFSDAWIRREIEDYWKTVDEDLHPSHPVFATCDLMNALAASAESLAVLYFSSGNEEETYPCTDMEKLVQLLVNLSVSFERTEIEDRIYEGIWQGKTIREWHNDCLRVSKK